MDTMKKVLLVKSLLKTIGDCAQRIVQLLWTGEKFLWGEKEEHLSGELAGLDMAIYPF